MRILITGGAGFLGSALANRLVEDGHDVRVIDNLRAGDPARLDRRVLFTRGDVADVPKLWTLLQDVECVYHLAARVSVSESIQYPRDYNHDNVGGTVSLMEAIRDAGVRRVVFTSSGAVYGEQSQQPLYEDMIPNPDSPYGVSKFAAETYVRTIGKLWEIETVSLRIFNAYGPGQQLPPAHPPVIPHFLKSVLRGASLVVYGQGQQTRDFVYLDDVIDALTAAATAPDIDQHTINVGSGQETSVQKLVETIGRVLGKEVDPLYSTAQTGGVKYMCADITRARQLLGFEPGTDLQEGIQKVLELDHRFQ